MRDRWIRGDGNYWKKDTVEHKSNFSVMNDCFGSVPNKIPEGLLNTALECQQDRQDYPHENAMTKLEPL